MFQYDVDAKLNCPLLMAVFKLPVEKTGISEHGFLRQNNAVICLKIKSSWNGVNIM